MNLIEKHIRKTEKLTRAIKKSKIADWLLNQGYFPGQYILPPTFKVSNFHLEFTPKNTDINNLVRREIISISYPKTLLTSREFGIQHPTNYHDIVIHLINNWDDIVDLLFNKKNKIYSYSSPIPVNAKDEGNFKPLALRSYDI